MFHTDTRRARRAFTLVEMLTVMGIMLLLATIVVIAVAPFLKGRSLASGARVVQGAIYQARAYAATQRTSATVYFDPEEGTVSVYATPYIVPGRYANRVDQPEHLPAGVDFKLEPVSGAVVTDPSGGTAKGNTLVFSPTGSLNPLYMGTGNCSIRLMDAAGVNVKRITVVFASGMTKSEDE